MVYQAPQNIQSIWDALPTDQKQQIAQQVGFNGWNPGQNDFDFNAFVEKDPSAFEQDVMAKQTPQGTPQYYQAPSNIQSIWDALPQNQKQDVARQSGFYGWTPGQNDVAFNTFVGADPSAFEKSVMATQNPPPQQTQTQAPYKPQTTPLQGMYDRGTMYGGPGYGGGFGYNGYGGFGFNPAFGQQNGQQRPQVPQGYTPYQYDSGFGYTVPGQTNTNAISAAGGIPNTNFLADTPSAQTSPWGSHDYGAAARGTFQFRQGGRIR